MAGKPARSGRKPKGTVAGRSVTVRMPDDVFGDLEAAIKRHPNPSRTLTDEIVGRLRAHISKEREYQRDPALRDWCFLIAEVASYAHYQTPGWHRNPFWYGAFKLAVIGLLNALEPKGEIKPPKGLDPSVDHETPEAQAKAAVNIVLHHLHGMPSRERLSGTGDWSAELLDELDSDRNAYARVRHHLQLVPIQKKGDSDERS
jgi:hypothetical protein